MCPCHLAANSHMPSLLFLKSNTKQRQSIQKTWISTAKPCALNQKCLLSPFLMSFHTVMKRDSNMYSAQRRRRNDKTRKDLYLVCLLLTLHYPRLKRSFLNTPFTHFFTRPSPTAPSTPLMFLLTPVCDDLRFRKATFLLSACSAFIMRACSACILRTRSKLQYN